MSRKRESKEYHLICRTTGESHGGFATLVGAREYAREEELEAWDIFHGNRLVERREQTSSYARQENGQPQEKKLEAWDIFHGHLIIERREQIH
jgi:hypothetical protein